MEIFLQYHNCGCLNETSTFTPVYKSLSDCITDLEKNGHLIRIKEQIDPNLEMAAVHLRVFEKKGPAILFENVKGSPFKAVSNLFGTMDRAKFIFRNDLERVKKVIAIRNDPASAIIKPIGNLSTAFQALSALPKKKSNPEILQNRTTISNLPQIKCWPLDGGAFITLPQVFSLDPDSKSIMTSNVGMYRIQMSGNHFIPDKEIGLHYQIHRGIGVHQSKASKKNQPLKVSIFVGGHPAHTLAAVMPLPENMSELTFAGLLAGRRFRYSEHEGHIISNEADFVITGEIYPFENKPEGPFGDHLGYYSLVHDFPVMKVKNVFHRRDAIWPFTVVGRPPQEDTIFGELIHDLTGTAIPKEIPGLKEVNAVDAAGVHPLLFAIGSERYTPFTKEDRPQEILTIANRILGTGQLSLAKYLFICNSGDAPPPTSQHEKFLMHMLERINLERDFHFQTNTTIDTLDYSGSGFNSGSKVILAACGSPVRELSQSVPHLKLPDGYTHTTCPFPGVLVISAPQYKDGKIRILIDYLEAEKDLLKGFPMIVIADDSRFTSNSINNFLWVTFTKSNPAQDIYGLFESTNAKHWSCKTSFIIDARTKPHHAPALEKSEEVERNIDRFFKKDASLEKLI